MPSKVENVEEQQMSNDIAFYGPTAIKSPGDSVEEAPKQAMAASKGIGNNKVKKVPRRPVGSPKEIETIPQTVVEQPSSDKTSLSADQEIFQKIVDVGTAVAKQIRKNSVAPEPVQAQEQQAELPESPSEIRLRQLSRQSDRLAEQARRMLQGIEGDDDNCTSFLPTKYRALLRRAASQELSAPPQVTAVPQYEEPRFDYYQESRAAFLGEQCPPVNICLLLENLVYHKADDSLCQLEGMLIKTMQDNKFCYELLYCEDEISHCSDERDRVNSKIEMLQKRITAECKVLQTQRQGMLEEWAKQDDEKRARKEASRKSNVFKRMFYYVNKEKLKKKREVAAKLHELETIEREQLLESLNPEIFLAKCFEELDELINREKNLSARIVTGLLSFTVRQFAEVVAASSSQLKRQQSSIFELWQEE